MAWKFSSEQWNSPSSVRGLLKRVKRAHARNEEKRIQAIGRGDLRRVTVLERQRSEMPTVKRLINRIAEIER